MITKRIQEIAKWIKEDQSVIDVGCDHGYLAKELREHGHRAAIICSDNKKGPLDNAKGNLAGYENILYLLCDGLNDLSERVDVIVMAGMGNNTIEHILSDAEATFDDSQQLILQCNTNVPQLRKWLSEHDFTIIDEMIVFDRKYYIVMKVQKGRAALTELQMEYGPILLAKRSELFLEFMSKEKQKYEVIVKGINEQDEDAIAIAKKIKEINDILNSN